MGTLQRRFILSACALRQVMKLARNTYAGLLQGWEAYDL